jgi:hypothetical protein
MAMAQLSGRVSLRDLISNLSAQIAKLYHLGTAIVSCSSLARINEQQPYTLYEQLAGTLLQRCQTSASPLELFFKWIKQNLEIKSSLGTSRNTVMTQI